MSAIPAHVPKSGESHQELATIVSVEPELRVETESGVYPARLAASCLLQPALTDVVLVAVPPRGARYVLAVLERESDEPMRLRLDGDAQLALPTGRLSVVAKDGIDLVTSARLGLASGSLEVSAEEGQLSIGRLVTRSKEVLARVGTLDGVFDAIDTAAERLTQRLGRSQRFIEETDLTRAQEIDTRAERTLLMRAKDALVGARRLVKLDGEQIHLG